MSAMAPWQVLLLAWGLAAVAQALGWRWQQQHRNAGIVDVVWAATLGSAALLLAVTGGGHPLQRLLLALMAGAWALRLSLHLWRRMGDGVEDGRYAALRARWGDGGWRWLALFQLQALLVPLFALPWLAVAANPSLRPGWALAALLLYGAALLGETVADAQLQRFRSDPRHRGQTCRQGLWRHSRHPNYFFEWLLWFAWPLLAVGSPLWLLAWTGPLTMYVFLRWLSGIPHTEAQALRSRGDDYRRYQAETPVLVPWPRFGRSWRAGTPPP